MAKFIKENKGELPQMNTSSLPDIVFIILMFFMVCTSMRQNETKVRVRMPQATEIAKLDRKDLSISALLPSNIRRSTVRIPVFSSTTSSARTTTT